jgi:serine/threonine-protein kinase
MPHSVGDVIGERYRLIDKIGEGGMATVWEAEHVALGSLVAVKFLHRTAPQDSELAQRFLREARVAASVKHRNVVEINDFGFTKEEVPYMVMERLVGESLAEFLHQRGSLPFHDATRLASLTLRGLTAVHNAGIVHRDLKPDNIFLVRDDDGVFPKLLDFGLSRRVGRTDMTLEGTLMGTPDYMSPEQARGQTDLDARTDIYSMGVILYEMISAHMPYESDLIGDLIAMISRDPPTPVTKYRADAPAELVEVIERAMAKRREERFPDARAMRTALGEAWNELVNSSSDSDLASLSEFPHPGFDDTGTDQSITGKRTPMGRRPSPRFSSSDTSRVSDTGEHADADDSKAPFVQARATPGGVIPSNTNESIATDPTVAERVGFVEAPTLIAPGTSLPSKAQARDHQPRSLLSSLFALGLAAAAGATFAGVWIASGEDHEDFTSFGEASTVSTESVDAGSDAGDESTSAVIGAAPVDSPASTTEATLEPPEPEEASTAVEPTRTTSRPQVSRPTQAERVSKRRPLKRQRETPRRSSSTKRRPSPRRR